MIFGLNWKKAGQASGLLLVGLLFGYIFSHFSGFACLIFIPLGLLVGLLYGFRYSWWFTAGVFFGGSPIYAIYALLLFAIDDPTKWQVPLLAGIAAFLSAIFLLLKVHR